MSAPGVASISLSAFRTTVAVGGTVQLSATIRDSSGNVIQHAAVTWATSNPAVATVSTAGLVQAVGAGFATITASFGGTTRSAIVTVTPANPSLKVALPWRWARCHSCALTTNGVAYCWGQAGAQLGTGSVMNASVPARHHAATLRQLAASTWETCGVTIDNALYCWGHAPNYTDSEPSPTRILPGVSVKAISVGLSHDCALASLVCRVLLGLRYYGELGGDSAAFATTCPVSSSIPQPICNTPTPVAGGLLFQSINVDDYEGSCSITTSGAAYC